MMTVAEILGTTGPRATCLSHGIPLAGEASHGLILKRRKPSLEGGSLLTWGGAGIRGQEVLLQRQSMKSKGEKQRQNTMNGPKWPDRRLSTAAEPRGPDS